MRLAVVRSRPGLKPPAGPARRVVAHRMIASALVLLLAGAGTAGAGGAGESGYQPLGLLLTWQRDPARTITIDWHALEDEEPRVLKFRPADGSDAPARADNARDDDADDWNRAEPDTRPFPHSDRLIHRVELTDLEPDTLYAFRIGPDGRELSFRTMPAEMTRPIRFAAGGDVQHSQEMMERTNRQAAKQEPEFILWGGDLAYADARPDRVERWFTFFEAILNTLILEDGRVIPVVVAIGNHEVRQGYYTRHEHYEQTDTWRNRIAPFFYALFAFPGQPGYAALDFGDYLSVIALDTRHTNPIIGTQTDWLRQTLRERRDVTHVVPFYHVPAYPSHRRYEGSTSRGVRRNWVPFFERYGVRFAVENHDHTYKRTHPIRGGEVDEERGIVYIGDGAWGVGVREVHPPEETWYLAEARSVRHLILVTLDGDDARFEVIDEDGETIDEFAIGADDD